MIFLKKNLFLAKMYEKDSNKIEISNVLGINKRSLDRRLENKTKFSIKDINSLKRHFNLTNDEVVEIFINE